MFLKMRILFSTPSLIENLFKKKSNKCYTLQIVLAIAFAFCFLDVSLFNIEFFINMITLNRNVCL